MSSADFQTGKRVRVKSAPDRIGVLVGEVKLVAGRRRWDVQFPQSLQQFPERNLELIVENETIEDLIRNLNFGGAKHLRGAITHSRLTGRLADVIYSMEATNTEFFPYQYKPVLNFLDSPSNGLLIADEVGMGKTIEAGLIWTELRARMDAKRLLVLCPAFLREKWRSELLHRFGVRAEICNANELLGRIREVENLTLDDFAIIASLQGIRPPKDWESSDQKSGAGELARYINELAADAPIFDCVIVDEAHYLRNPDSQTHKLAHLIRPVTVNILLLSATPVQLRSDDLFHLLNIIDGENFEFKKSFDEVLSANSPLLRLASALRSGKCSIQELEEGVKACMSHHLLADSRQLKDIFDNFPSASELNDVDYRIRLADRVERVNLLANVVNRTRKRDVHGDKVTREPSAPTIPMNEVERAFYNQVTDSVREYCKDYGFFEGFMLTIPQRQLCSSMPAALRAWIKKTDKFDEDIIYETLGGEVEESCGPPIKREGESIGPLVQKLSSLAKSIGNYEELRANDSKYNQLRQLLKDYWTKNPGKKVILFSYFRETLAYLRERLADSNIPASLLMGGMGDLKEQTIDEFRSTHGPQILLASEVLSEGVDLQFSAIVINFDLPWNPMRIEQRIGRIDRIGQKQDRIMIYNFFYEGSLDDRIYNRLFERLDIFRYALGDLEAVLGERIRSLTYDLLSHDLSENQELERIEQTRRAIARQRQLQEDLERDAVQLQAHGDYVLNRVTAAKELQRYINGASLWVYVRDYLQQHCPGSQLTRTSDELLTAEIRLSVEGCNGLQRFIDKHRGAGRTALASSSSKTVTCVFDNKVDFGQKKHEVINQSHPLVRFVANQVNMKDFHQATALTLSSGQAAGVAKGRYLVIAKRWSTRGARTVERLVFRALPIGHGAQLDDEGAEKLVNAALSFGEDWHYAKAHLEATELAGVHDELEIRLDDEFEEYAGQMAMENDDRVDFLIKTLTGQVGRQVQSRRDAIEKLRVAGNDRIIKLNQSMIKKLEEKCEQRIAVFNQQRKIHSEPQDVISGVFNVV